MKASGSFMGSVEFGSECQVVYTTPNLNRFLVPEPGQFPFEAFRKQNKN